MLAAKTSSELFHERGDDHEYYDRSGENYGQDVSAQLRGASTTSPEDTSAEVRQRARAGDGLRLLLREEKKNEEESSAPEGVDERRREAREQAPRLQIHITCSASAEPPSHNTRAPASQRRTHQGRQATTTIFTSCNLEKRHNRRNYEQ